MNLFLSSRLPALLGLVLMPLLANAQTAILCEGFNPDWRLESLEDEVIFTWNTPTPFQVRHTTYAQDNTPVAVLTLLGERATALLILRTQECSIRSSKWATSATLLTEANQTPVVLAGCCLTAPDLAPAK